MRSGTPSKSPRTTNARKTCTPTPHDWQPTLNIRQRSAGSARNWTNSVRGDVYRLKRPRSAQGHEQQGERYAVVVQANAYDHLSTWLLAPTTTKSFGSMIPPPLEPPGQAVRVLPVQTTAVARQRLGAFAGCLAPDELMEVKVALRAVLD